MYAYDLESGIDSVTGEGQIKMGKRPVSLPKAHRAMLARKDGKEPLPDDLKECILYEPKIEDLKCFNGRRSDRPECGYHGSNNIPYYVAAGGAFWEWIAAASKLEREEGNFHSEVNCAGEFYHGGVIECKLLAEKELRKLGLNELAELCRLAVRSNLSWNALPSFPVERKYDILIEANKKKIGGWVRREGVFSRKIKPPFTSAPAGNRFTAIERNAICGGNSPSDILWKELTDFNNVGLNQEEISIIGGCIAGDYFDASYLVKNFVFGTKNTPDRKWHFRFRRFKEGAELLFFGPGPNSMKACRTVTQIHSDGRYIGMKPIPRGKYRNWGSDKYNVEIVNGIIHAECGAGEAELPEMTGNLLWEVNIKGNEITITR